MIAFRLNDKAVFDSVAHGNDWHLTLDDAIAHAPELKPHDAYEAVSAAIAKATGCSA